MISNLNYQKQISSSTDKAYFFKQSFFNFPEFPSKSFLQTNFSNNILSESNFVPVKPSTIRLKGFSIKNQSKTVFFSHRRLRFQKKLRTLKRRRRNSFVLRAIKMKKNFTLFMSDSLKTRRKRKNFLGKTSKNLRLSFSSILPENTYSLKKYSIIKRKFHNNYKVSYLSFLRSLRFNSLSRPLRLKRLRYGFRIVFLGFKQAFVYTYKNRRRRKLLRKNGFSMAFSPVKFYRKKKRFSCFKSLKLKVSCFPSFQA